MENGSPFGIGIIGCGNVVQKAHLPAYVAAGMTVVGVFDPNEAAIAGVRAIHPTVEIFPDVDSILADERIAVVDIATHPSIRPGIVERSLLAGKHVLSQKPFADDLATAVGLVEAAEAAKRQLAVNQNGRWSPPWKAATALIQQGVIGDVVAVTHQFHKDNWWTPGSPFDRLDHCAIHDYAIHWIDISICWFGGDRPSAVRARDYRTPSQPAESHTPWGAWVELEYHDGRNAMIRAPGLVLGERATHPFWVHGTKGTLRGSQLGTELLEVALEGEVTPVPLRGNWFPDAFAGTMSELQSAILESRRPSHDGRNNLVTLEATLAAVKSAENGGCPVSLPLSCFGSV
jgi:predicted dehydrogenase